MSLLQSQGNFNIQKEIIPFVSVSLLYLLLLLLFLSFPHSFFHSLRILFFWERSQNNLSGHLDGLKAWEIAGIKFNARDFGKSLKIRPGHKGNGSNFKWLKVKVRTLGGSCVIPSL